MWNQRVFFDQLLESRARRQKGGRAKVLPVSIALHVVAAAVVLIVPLLASDDMPEIATSAITAFIVEPAAAPPPPPPPPPPAARKAAVTTPKIERPQPVPVEAPKFTAPVEVPDVVPEGGNALGAEFGVEAGVPEGVAGGVTGGIPGGVVGGVVGGVLGGVPEPEAMPPPPKPQAPVRVGGQIKEPRKLNEVAPRYPEIARAARVEGVVVLEATISPGGRVSQVRVVRGIPLLNDAATAAVRQWRYSPTLLNGQPVPVIMTVTVNFKLS